MQIVVGAYGWQHEQWEKTFYPEDIPPDWRLNYYANEFEAVLVPFRIWSTSDNSELKKWMGDLPENFQLFFEASAGHEDQAANKVLLDGLLLYPPVIFSPAKYNETSVQFGMQEALLEGSRFGQSDAVLLRIFAADVINPEQIRQIIERVQEGYSRYETIYLFFDQTLADMSILSTASIIVDLLITHD